jgi:cytochrome c1
MTTDLRRAALAAVAFVGSVSVALAQPAVPGAGGVASPPLSPYLNLLRNNSNNANPAFNYLTITRPQMQFNQAANALNQQLQATNFQLQQQAAAQNGVVILGGDTTQPVTGHRVSFGNLGGHFGSLGGGAGGGRVGGPMMGAGMSLPGGNLGRPSSLGSTFGGGIGARGVGGIGVAGVRR